MKRFQISKWMENRQTFPRHILRCAKPRSVHWLMFVKGRFPKFWMSRWSRYIFFQVTKARLGNEVVYASAFWAKGQGKFWKLKEIQRLSWFRSLRSSIVVLFCFRVRGTCRESRGPFQQQRGTRAAAPSNQNKKSAATPTRIKIYHAKQTHLHIATVLSFWPVLNCLGLSNTKSTFPFLCRCGRNDVCSRTRPICGGWGA